MLAKAEIRITKKKTLFSDFRTGTFRFFGLGEGDTRILFFIRVSPLLARGDFHSRKRILIDQVSLTKIRDYS